MGQIVSLAERARIAVAILAVSALAMAGCQTTGDDQPPGAVTGGIAGGAAGLGAEAGVRAASGGHAGNPLLGLLVGAVVGVAVGGASTYDSTGAVEGGSGLPLSSEDRALSDAATNKAGDSPVGERVEWTSVTEDGVHGWAAPHSAVKVFEGRECRFLDWGYVRGSDRFSQVSRFCRQSGKWVLG